MPHRKSAATKQKNEQFRSYLLAPATLAALEHLTAADILSQGTAHVLQHRNTTPAHDSSESQTGSSLRPVIKRLQSALKQDRKNAGYANHTQKRGLIKSLLGHRSPPSISAHIRKHGDNIEEAIRTSVAELGFELLLCDRQSDDYRQFHGIAVVEPGTPRRNIKPPNQQILTVTPESGFYFVKPEQSIVFISIDSAGVIRGVALDAPFAKPLYDWLMSVVEAACHVRRDCRPYHQGEMVQWGLNMGPRHRHILGWAKSFRRKLSELALKALDTDAIGATSLFWALARTYPPAEVIDPLQDYLDKAALPSMGTLHVASGCGFAIEVDDLIYDFSTARRAPPEGLATYRYASPGHRDGSATGWGISWCTGSWGNEKGGNAYVDLSLRVVVLPARGTLQATRPRSYHASTTAIEPESGTAGFTIVFTDRIDKAYPEFMHNNEIGTLLPFSPDHTQI
ncbi:hypothetical protein PC9H_010252 [Pleurotus ostreatus]|uniref:Uncharacterized protein n=1 Tax=Pleurotus ostreatus TaxID=5322 RepID=A0A8H6ZSR7_PLEOS|nr:uncharacterized protein PC9H_010252 [Pleurotus ostreatus]KAF7424941.1 hypothetical protein PC9H_010252 [Pleurotus ostreatus]KAJ8690926.1 hypothetical protein PTI98_010544 [Pleurotus ostreatus]KAJ8694547.1 hypothetical protein PTI98_007211 [Pleurotus ostreatus]